MPETFRNACAFIHSFFCLTIQLDKGVVSFRSFSDTEEGLRAFVGGHENRVNTEVDMDGQ